MGKVLAMYDVRGIQKYIFRTAKVKDAIGASAIVEKIIEDALEYAVDKLKLTADLQWFNDDGIVPYRSGDQDVQVLYVGGGNAYIICRDRELCLQINRHMAKYVIEHTYSLQLAAAMTDVTGDYAADYNNLMNDMNDVKANMVMSKPLGALPVMKLELKTGYPVSAESAEDESTESLLKKETDKKVRNEVGVSIKKFDNYATKKGVDSTLAVVHIDGNNMGLRIRKVVSDIHDYEQAVNKMRRISYNISSSYQKVFEGMQTFFNENAGRHKAYKEKETDNFILKVLVAGDDITYVCNGQIAIATVEYFCRNITDYALIEPETTDPAACERNLKDYGFSVCAGIAYIGSHFPFHVGYEVAEACCESAKESAKKKENKDGERIGNWVDFQICKNVQAKDLKAMRNREYVTSRGESLLNRPYFISTKTDGALDRHKDRRYALGRLKSDILYFQNEKNLPRSFAKTLRNTYPLGEMKTESFYNFLKSRDWKMPVHEQEKEQELLYYVLEEQGQQRKYAKWYDALEMMDYYIDLDVLEAGAKDENV